MANYKTTKAHFSTFVAMSKSWAEKLGLHDWSLHYYHGGELSADEALAYCNHDATGRVASITLNGEWPEHVPVTKEQLDMTAFHELCHVLLSELVGMAKERVTTDNMLLQAQHAIIRRLERMVLK